VLKMRLIVTYLAILTGGIIATGFLFNLVM
jgi:hypothetical protein